MGCWLPNAQAVRARALRGLPVVRTGALCLLAGYFAFDADNKMPELALELLSKGIDEKG